MKNKIKYSNKESKENNLNNSQPNIPISDIISKTKFNPNFKGKLEIIGSIKVKQPSFLGEYKQKLALNNIFNKISEYNFANRNQIKEEKEKYSCKFILYPKKKMKKSFFGIKKINKKESMMEKINEFVQTIKKPKKKSKRTKSFSTISQSNSTLYSKREISSNILEELKLDNNEKKNYLTKKNNTLKNKKIKILLKYKKVFNSKKTTKISDNVFSLIQKYRKKRYESVSINTDQEIKKLYLLKNKRLLTYTKENQTEIPKELRLNFAEYLSSLCFYSPKENKKTTKFKDNLLIDIINELKNEKKEINKTENRKIVKNFNKKDKKYVIKAIKINNGFEKIKNSKAFLKGIHVYNNNKEVNIFSNPLKINKVKSKLNTKNDKKINTKNKINFNKIPKINPKNHIVQNESFQIEKENLPVFQIKAGDKMHHILNNYLFRDQTFSKNNISNNINSNSTMNYFAHCNSNNNYDYYKLNKKIQNSIKSSIKERRTLSTKNNKTRKIIDGQNLSCDEIIGCKYNPYGLDWTSNIIQKNFENTKIFTNFGTFNNYPLYIRNYSMNKAKKPFYNVYKY